MDICTINWGSAADWASAVGSVSAVITALYLSRSGQKIRLRGYCGHRVLIGGGDPREELFFIAVTNVGTRPTIISSIGVTAGLFRSKKHAILTFDRSLTSDGLPFSLNDGEEGKWSIPLGEGHLWLKELSSDFLKSRLDIETLRIIVQTTHGEILKIKPEKNLKKMIKEAAITKNG